MHLYWHFSGIVGLRAYSLDPPEGGWGVGASSCLYAKSEGVGC